MKKIGLDLGGTKLFGIITEGGKIIKQDKALLPEIKSPQELAKFIGRFYHSLIKAHENGEFDRVGLAVPSPVDSERGIAKYITAFQWKDIPMAELVEPHIQKPILLENDVNAATLAEFKFGAGRGVDSLYTFYPGTGLGGGYISGGNLIQGFNHTAAEVGHMVVRMDGPVCNCGRRGCLEAMVSNRGFKRMLNKRLSEGKETPLSLQKHIRSDDLVNAWLQEDGLVREILSLQARALGIGIANVINITGVARIIIGGNVYHKLKEDLVPIVRNSAEEHSIGGGMDGVEIRLNALGNEAPALGMTLL